MSPPEKSGRMDDAVVLERESRLDLDSLVADETRRRERSPRPTVESSAPVWHPQLHAQLHHHYGDEACCSAKIYAEKWRHR